MKTTNTPSDRAASLLIVDEHPLVREGITLRVDATTDLITIGQADSIETALDILEQRPVDIVLLDLQLHSGGGLELAKRLAVQYPDTRVVLHTTTEPTTEQMVTSGAAAFVVKELIGDRLIDTLQGVATTITHGHTAPAQTQDADSNAIC